MAIAICIPTRSCAGRSGRTRPPITASRRPPTRNWCARRDSGLRWATLLRRDRKNNNNRSTYHNIHRSSNISSNTAPVGSPFPPRPSRSSSKRDGSTIRNRGSVGRASASICYKYSKQAKHKIELGLASSSLSNVLAFNDDPNRLGST